MPTPSRLLDDGLPADGPSVVACPDCGRLFALATDSPPRVACPACGSIAAINDLAPQTLAYAIPADAEPIPTPPPAPPVRITVDPPSEGIEATAETAETIATPAPAGVEDTAGETLPTVADWLQKSERESPLRDKPSLAKSLGWDPGSFRLDGSAERDAPTDDHATTLAEAATDLAGGAAAGNDFNVELNLSSEALEPEPSTADEPVERPAGSPTEALFAAEAEKRSPRWVKPLTALAGMLAVVAPAAWVTQQFGPWADGPLESAAVNRAERLGEPRMDEAMPFKPGPTADQAAAAPAFGASEEQPVPQAPEPRTSEIATTTPPIESSPVEPSPPAEFATPAAPIVDPATQPASFEQTPPSPAGGRYAAVAEPTLPAEPLPFAPRADTAPLPEIGQPSTVAELAAAIAAAEPARAGFQQGTLADPDQLADMGTHYARLCHLADTITRFDPASLGPAAATDTTEIEAADLFRRLFQREKPRRQSLEIAGPWIEWTDRPHDGVFFAGVPVDVGRAGELYEYRFQLGEQIVPMISAEPIDADRYLLAGGKEMGVIGVVVDRPAERIPGYVGEAQRVVWVRKTLPLGEPVAP